MARALGSVHRLQEEMPEIERCEALRLGSGLRVNQLQLVAARLAQRRS
jgi:hypothetical protein